MDGGELVEIPLTVLGVVGGASAEGEIVLIRLHGERFEHVGIIAGMSGSPVYVRDRLLGALAFGWAFAKDPIAGVTPFSRMETLAGGGGAVPASGSATLSLAALVAAVRSGGVGPLVLSWLFPATEVGAATSLRLPVAASGAAGACSARRGSVSAGSTPRRQRAGRRRRTSGHSSPARRCAASWSRATRRCRSAAR